MNTKLKMLWETKTKNDEWWSSFVTSPIAILINYFVIDWKIITPNRITIISFIFACVSAVLMIWGGTLSFIFAVFFINLSHVFDCMDGQIARYRNISSNFGSYFDKTTDQIKVYILWGAFTILAYNQTKDPTAIFLGLSGLFFYGLRGYVKYVTLYIKSEMVSSQSTNDEDLDKITESDYISLTGSGLVLPNKLLWLLKEQRKFFLFDEGVFIFLLSFGLFFQQFMIIMWIFGLSQLFYGLLRSIQRGVQIKNHQLDKGYMTVEK